MIIAAEFAGVPSGVEGIMIISLSVSDRPVFFLMSRSIGRTLLSVVR